MSIFTNRRNIRVTKPNLMRLISRGIVDRRNISKSGIHTVFFGVPYAYAKRINSISDIEVLLNDNWNFVRNMDYEKLESLYKDELKNKKVNDIIVVNKPEGMVVHPGNGNPNGTLVNAILAKCKGSLSGIGGKIRQRNCT